MEQGQSNMRYCLAFSLHKLDYLLYRYTSLGRPDIFRKNFGLPGLLTIYVGLFSFKVLPPCCLVGCTLDAVLFGESCHHFLCRVHNIHNIGSMSVARVLLTRFIW